MGCCGRSLLSRQHVLSRLIRSGEDIDEEEEEEEDEEDEDEDETSGWDADKSNANKTHSLEQVTQL